MKITARQLTDIYLDMLLSPARKKFDIAVWVSAINLACEKYQINTPLRLSAFLAQVGHESGQLRYTREIWGPTPQQARYEGRADLGNTQPGDGSLYRGRGLIQITGRANYRELTKNLGCAGIDFEERPQLLEQPLYAALSAGYFFSAHGCNELADIGAFGKMTKVINGGLNGYPERCKLYGRAKDILGAE